MSLADKVIDKAQEFIGVKENPPESNNVKFNTDYYGYEVSDSGSSSYPWCVTFLWDIFKMCNASHVFCDGVKTASTETVYAHYKNKNMLFLKGQKGDIALFLTAGADNSRNVNHAGLVICKNSDGSYETIEGNTGGSDIANGGMVMRKTRNVEGRGYKIVGFARPNYSAQNYQPGNHGLLYNEIPISAKLTLQASGLRVRMSPNTNSSVVKNLSEGTVVYAYGRIASRKNPWFHIFEGWISGNFVKGWIKDYDNNRRWWYVEKGYKYAKSEWRKIAGKDYCFGKDSYLFVECYIKSAVREVYYWVDDDGVYKKQYDTAAPDRRYRIVENYKTENAL